MSIEKIQTNIQKVHELKSGVTGMIKDAVFAYRSEKGKIRSNRMLTDEGKHAEEKKLQAQFEKAFMGQMLKVDEEKKRLITEGKNEAMKVLTATLPPVSETKQKLFDMELKKAEGKVTFALGANSAVQALESLINQSSEPILAQQARELFLKQSSHVIGLANDSEKSALKQRLNNMFQQLDSKATTDEQKQAKVALESISALEGSGYCTGYVKEALGEISKKTSDLVNTPKAYFDSVGE